MEGGETKSNDCIVPSLKSQGAPGVMLKLMAARQQVSQRRSINIRLSAPLAAAQPDGEEVDAFLALLMTCEDDVENSAPVDVHCDIKVEVTVQPRIARSCMGNRMPVARCLDLPVNDDYFNEIMDDGSLGMLESFVDDIYEV